MISRQERRCRDHGGSTVGSWLHALATGPAKELGRNLVVHARPGHIYREIGSIWVYLAMPDGSGGGTPWHALLF